MSLGTKIGMIRTATILQYNKNSSTIRIGLDEGQGQGVPHTYDCPIPGSWTGPTGEFIGGFPAEGTSVIAGQGQGGQWYIISYVNSNDVFDQPLVSRLTRMSALKPGRALIQVKNDNRLFLDPKIGTQIGGSSSFQHLNPNRNILSHTFEEEMKFTDGSMVLDQRIRRDLVENASRNILSSTLNSQSYNDSLFSIGFDPSISVAVTTRDAFNRLRNPALMENRELTREFGRSFRYTTDQDESARYKDSESIEERPAVDKRKMRSDVLSLSLEHPNHLIETIKGTVVDSIGNIIDLNRAIIPLGKVAALSLGKNNEDKSKAYDNMRAAYRKSIGFHFEMNSRKGSADTSAQPAPDPDNKSDYARSRSKFQFDIDKEGQFKLNIPSSSEIGNIPLLTRYETYSVLLSKDDESVNPNSFVRSENKQDIFLESFAPSSHIDLTPESSEEYGQAFDRFDETPIKLGTAFHDITQVLSTFRNDASFREQGIDLVQVDPNHPLNKTETTYDTLVTEDIIVSGPNSNAGGRSGLINLDGFISLNVGANTVDRQSMWADFAGGILTRIGRDKQGISYGASLDGDMLIQIGGSGLGNALDSRFADQNDAVRNGTFDLRVFVNNQLMIFRMDETGVHIISPGRMTFYAEQDMIFKTNSKIKMQGELITMYAESNPRTIIRSTNTI